MTFKQKIISVIEVVCVFVLMASVAYACEPCVHLKVEESINKSGLIIIGQKIADGPHTDPRPEGFGGPDWIEVKIIKVLKGNINQNQIRVNSWEGMCDYGITVDESEYVMLLEHYTDSQSDGEIKELIDLKERYLNIVNDTGYSEEIRKGFKEIIEDTDKKIKIAENTKVEYNAVNFGCAVKTFLVEDNMIDFEDKKISLDDFITKFNLNKTK